MLYRTHIERAVIEHRGVNAIDDVVVYYRSPGLNERGTQISVDFYQLKFHVARNGHVDSRAVIDPNWTGTKQPLLRRFADEWKVLRASHPNARLSLVTNWPWHPEDRLAPHLRDGGALADAFFTSGGRSAVGTIRKDWQKASGLPENDFVEFARRLRFSHTAVSLEDAELWLQDRCQLAGLKPVLAWEDHSRYDDLGQRLIESGRLEFTPEQLRALCAEQGLFDDARSPAFASTLAVRSFSRFAHDPQGDGAMVIDFTDLFDGRAPGGNTVWTEDIPRRIDAAIPGIMALKMPVQIALDAHLSIAWYLGTVLNPKCGIPVVLRQKIRGKGLEIWDISRPAPDSSAGWSFVEEPVGDGKELAVAVSVTWSAVDDVRPQLPQLAPSVGILLHAALPVLGGTAIEGGAHARRLADSLVEHLVGRVRALGVTRLHLFAACPVSLGFLIGQQADVFGPTTVYEFDFGRTRAYAPGMRIPLKKTS
ncbi:MAG TPA: SAVED domain-containing protein [Polyangiaceae bacterium]|nr:SAVED domain-containing protein [Polyangiaceae bacterium]